MASTLFTRQFWADAVERAIKSCAQAITLAIGGGVANILTVDWQVLGGAGLTGAVLSLLTSIGSAGIANRGTASLTNAVEPAAR
jgi:hypothetical protein